MQDGSWWKEYKEYGGMEGWREKYRERWMEGGLRREVVRMTDGGRSINGGGSTTDGGGGMDGGRSKDRRR